MSSATTTHNFKEFCLRLSSALRIRRKKPTKMSTIQISAPFDFRKDTFALPGFSEDECARMKNAALDGTLNTVPMSVSVNA
ncbi:hypothetical protein HOO65_050668 [Ceratocystis lukuohia]|uniref:Uncharacterized protein n=3 Tax=Ceratocystis TaxID=5157 RepID=A0A0F8CPK2_CERFI|nr:hypothetical protein CFO_g5011 [Ceratocystis platani]PHH54827.1 hypothetical protein CFIMG_001225RA [Ceratocystis fimbriata CBS 114723]